jgi:hypothetical protein
MMHGQTNIKFTAKEQSMVETAARMEGTTFYLKHGSIIVTRDSELNWCIVSCAELQLSNIMCKRPNAREVMVKQMIFTNLLALHKVHELQLTQKPGKIAIKM